MSIQPPEDPATAVRKLFADTKAQRDLVRQTLGPVSASAAALRDVDDKLQLLRTPPVYDRPYERLAEKLAEPQYAAKVRQTLVEAEAKARREQVEREKTMVAALQGLRTAAEAQAAALQALNTAATDQSHRDKAMMRVQVLTLIAAVAAVVVAVVVALL